MYQAGFLYPITTLVNTPLKIDKFILHEEIELGALEIPVNFLI